MAVLAIIEQMAASIGVDISGMPKPGQAAEVVAWWRKTSPPMTMVHWGFQRAPYNKGFNQWPQK